MNVEARYKLPAPPLVPSDALPSTITPLHQHPAEMIIQVLHGAIHEVADRLAGALSASGPPTVLLSETTSSAHEPKTKDLPGTHCFADPAVRSTTRSDPFPLVECSKVSPS